MVRSPLLSAFTAILVLGAALAGPPPAYAEDRCITLASTTSTDNAGLFASILPKFTAATGIAVRVVAVGTEPAPRLGVAGDADMLLVHARATEDAFVAAGIAPSS